MKKLFKELINIIQENWKPYLWTSVFIYGAFAAGIIIAWLFPKLNLDFHHLIQGELRSGSLSNINDYYYLHRNVTMAIILTFWHNLVNATFISLSLPSLVIPFWGYLTGFIEVVFLGITIGPARILDLSAILLVMIEFQGYIIAIFGTYLLATRFINPKKYNIYSRKKGYVVGLKMLAKLYVLIIGFFFVAASYEVLISSNKVIFPNFSYTREQLEFSGAHVKMNYTGSYIYYDSLAVVKGDAKVVGIWLEDITYFKPNDQNSARVHKEDANYEIQLYLDDKYWDKNNIGESFDSMKKGLKKLYSGRNFTIQAFSFDSTGNKKIKYF